MHLYEKSNKRRFHSVFRSLVIFAAMLLVFAFLLGRTDGASRTRSEQVVKQAVTKAAVTCYTLEGRYPEDLQYLIDNYGLAINTDKYFVIYQPEGPNLMPNIIVSVK